MGEPIIRVENLSKRYRIGAKEQPYKTFREVITDAFTAPLRNLRRLRKLTKFDNDGNSHFNSPADLTTGKPADDDIIWALKDVSFGIRQGEVVGIIGRNGAGKSTLLKILSRITEPTTGDVKIYGRISSLLEVGTGFHPELTGRENIFLNGAILGMRKQEIKIKFDEIVAFAETEKFIDTPVKYYSSGMYVRLAFAVAAHLEPDILLVDEVLAVGDAAFQKKCLGKMGEVAKEGRTILFVSHNMGAVENLCRKAIYLNNGTIVNFSDSKNIISQYINDISETSAILLDERKDRHGDGRIRATRVELRSGVNNSRNVVRTGESMVLEIGYEVFSETNPENVTVALGIDDMTNNRIITLWSKFNNEIFGGLSGKGEFICEVPELCLRTGSYLLHVYIESNGRLADYVYNAHRFNVEYGKYYESGLEPVGNQGYILQRHHWKVL